MAVVVHRASLGDCQTVTVMLTATDCIICGCDAIADLLYGANFEPPDLNPAVFSGGRLLDDVHYPMVPCRKRGLVRWDPVADLDTLARPYEHSHGYKAPYVRLGNLYLIGRKR